MHFPPIPTKCVQQTICSVEGLWGKSGNRMRFLVLDAPFLSHMCSRPSVLLI